MATNDCWPTPADLWQDLNSQYNFILDAAANRTNHKCPRYYGPGGEAEDALSVDWPTDGWVWCNPPYSRGNQRKFVERAVDCANRGGKVLMLLPADTSTRLFHDIIYGQFDVRFVKGRIRFSGAPAPAKFGSMLVEFRV